MKPETTNAPRTEQDAQTGFATAVRLAHQIASLDMDFETKERVAATRLIQAAIEGRDRMHNERHAALVAALEKAMPALWLIASSGNADAVQIHEQARAALAAAKANT